MKVVVTGATGLLGRALMIRLLELGHEVRAVVRKKESITELAHENTFEWDALVGEFPVDSLRGVHSIIHLAGDPIADRRWTAEKKKRMVNSRVLGTRSLIRAIESLPLSERPKNLLSGSAIGIYGERGDEPLGDDAEEGSGFLAELCQHWEAEADHAVALGLRVVHLRTGIVLSRQGGALAKMEPITLGSGEQWMSWIHLTDWERFTVDALEDESLSGIYNLTAPVPVTNAHFTEVFRKVIGFKLKLRVPEFIVKSALGEMAQVVFVSQKVLPKRILETGFHFQYETLEQALTELYGKQSYLDQSFTMSQFVPEKVDEVFPFFSAATNLEKITPPWLNFKIKNQSTPQVQENTLINYRLKIHGVPARWQSQITEWKPGERFVDSQVKGPYAKWHHTHTFTKVPGGTLLGDRVIYRVPGNILGKTFLAGWIRNDVNTIFKYRRKIIDSIFGKKPPNG